MKIYMYLAHFPAEGRPLNTGTVKAVHGLARGLSANGVQVTILCEGDTERTTRAKAGYTIRSFAADLMRHAFILPRTLKTFVKADIRDGLVLLNGMFHPRVYQISRLLVQRNIPYICVPHSTYDQHSFQRKKFLKWPYWYLIERRMLRQAGRIQLLDQRHADVLHDLGVDTPVIQVSNGFSAFDLPHESDLTWRLDGPIRLFYFGRIDAYTKGLDILINAFSDMQPMDATLVMQGPDWGDQRRLEAQIKRCRLNDKISLEDPEYDIPATEVIRPCDIFCSPSRYEGFGLSVLEAMLAGRVILISESAGIAPYVEASGCGIVVQPNVQAVRAGLEWLIEHRSEWKEMGLRGRRYVLDTLDWKQVAGDALKEYTDVVNFKPQLSNAEYRKVVYQ